MWVEFLVEEPSMKAALDAFLPRLLPPPHGFLVSSLDSKEKLLKRLPERLKGLATQMNNGSYDDLRVVVLIDRDEDDCQVLKSQLEAMAIDRKLLTKTMASGSVTPFRVLNRIVCEELESWFFGDFVALQAAFPKLTTKHCTHQHLRNPDSIKGGTDRALLRALQKAGYYPPPLPNNRWKYDAAERIGPHLDPTRNTSPSFQAFVAGVRAFSLT